MRRRLTGLIAVLALAACAPVQQSGWTAPPGFAGPRLEAADFVSFDGAKLALQSWGPAAGDPWAVIIGVHGMDDDSNAFELAGPYWAEHGIQTIAYDQRGFGRSPEHGLWPGDGLMIEDLRTLSGLVRARYPHAIVAVAGESLGASVAIEAFASNDPPAADRLILLSPAVWGWSTQPPTYTAPLWVAAHLDPGWVIEPPRWVTKDRYASDNIEELRRMASDPYQIWGTRVDAIYGLVDSMQKAADALPRVRVPVAFLMGAHDQIIPPRPMKLAARGLKASDRSAFYANGWHLLLVDKQRDVVFADVESFVRDPSAPLPSGAPIVPGALTAANTSPALAQAAVCAASR
ncbi:MAG TPA: alpha/beta fold hydrolase [Caulobacteraceae bacterium]|nr:alpha/beta fold hydrolase [Caulobacteraceae bacterium]